MVEKPDGSTRVCIDYKKLNSVIVFVPEPMPTAEEIFAKLAGDRYFPKFALIKGYWQVPVYEEDRDLTTCVCHRGLFRFRAMQKARLYNQDNNTRNAIKTSEQQRLVRQKEAGRKRPRQGTVTRGDDVSTTSVRPSHSVALSSTRRRRT